MFLIEFKKCAMGKEKGYILTGCCPNPILIIAAGLSEAEYF